MKITVLGCGAAGGVPLLGNVWGNCDPSNPKNRRTRCSILVEDIVDNKTTSVLIDTSPDMREQLLLHNVQNIDAVVWTHSHADHCHGIDDLRSLNWLVQKPIPVYSNDETIRDLSLRFPYIFSGSTKHNKDGDEIFSIPSVKPHSLVFNQNGVANISVNHLSVNACLQPHGYTNTLGLRFGDFAYATDVSDFNENSIKMFSGIKVWLLGCIRTQFHCAHFNIEQALHWINIVKPQKTFLTHMNQDLDYQKLLDILPQGVFPAYDGLVIEC